MQFTYRKGSIPRYVDMGVIPDLLEHNGARHPSPVRRIEEYRPTILHCCRAHRARDGNADQRHRLDAREIFASYKVPPSAANPRPRLQALLPWAADLR